MPAVSGDFADSPNATVNQLVAKLSSTTIPAMAKPSAGEQPSPGRRRWNGSRSLPLHKPFRWYSVEVSF